MPPVYWHLVRSGRLQIIGSERLASGDPFQFLPLFRTHREAEFYCRQSGLWHQHIRPRHNQLVSENKNLCESDLTEVVAQAVASGAKAIGLFVGFNAHHESCWDYFRASQALNPLPENERPV